jgi:hypothetical protein
MMYRWEWELLYATLDYIEKVIPNQSPEIKNTVTNKIYQQMHRTLRPFHANHSAAQRQTKAVKTARADHQDDRGGAGPV